MSTTVDRALLSPVVSPRPIHAHGTSPAIGQSQQTVAAAAVVEGFGFWSGKDVRVEFRPAPPDTGIVFVREDLPQPVSIPADVRHQIESPRRTTLVRRGATVEMVEHVLAALAGLGIDNCEVGVDRAEMPGCDGSSLPFVRALQAAGIVEQPAGRPQLFIHRVTRVGDADNWIEARPATRHTLSIRYRLDYRGSSAAIGRQTNEFEITPSVFCRELAPSRTFMLAGEAQWLLSQGLGQRVRPTDVLVFHDEGPIDNQLRYDDECVRHKILDVIGDLALAGCQIVGQIVAHRSGHRLNAELVKALLQEGEIVRLQRKSA